MKKTESIALIGLGLTAVILGVIVVNDNRLIKYEKDSTSKKPFLTRERQNFLMKATIAKIALTGVIITWIVFDAKKQMAN